MIRYPFRARQSLQGELLHANSERAKMRQMVDEVLLLGSIAVAIMIHNPYRPCMVGIFT